MDTEQVFVHYKRPLFTDDIDVNFCSSCGAKMALVPTEERPRPRCSACGFTYYRQAGLGACVLVVDGDRVLLCRRALGGHEGQWCFPGGAIEFDEDWLTAVIRETKEETGLDVEIIALHTVVSNFFGPRSHTLVVVPLARAVGGEIQTSPETDMVAWFTRETLPELAFDAEQHIIERYFSAPFTGASVDPRYAGPRSSLT